MGRAMILGAVLVTSLSAALAASCADPTTPSDAAPVVTTQKPPEKGPVAFTPVATTMRRLLARQYTNAVRALLGPEGAAAAAPPEDPSIDGFDAIAARQLAVSDSAVAAYEASARAVAKAAMEDKTRVDKLKACLPVNAADALCFQRFTKNFGRLAFRRPLTDAELARYTQLGQATGAIAGNFYAGAEAIISAMLQSPRFLYMQETGALTGAGTLALTDFELLTRMSFFLLDTTPDESLLDLVETTGLKTEDQVRYVASTMLARLDAHAALAAFYDELYRLRELDDIGKDAALYPAFTPALVKSMREETRKLIEDVVWTRDADVREMFAADYTFVDSKLAAFYGVGAPSGDAFGKVSIPKGQGRVGVLGQAAFLSRFAHSTQTSPTLRGKLVREKVLCQIIPPPPPDVTAQLPPDDPNQGPQTMKQKLAKHQQDPVCASCHTLTDGIGLTFEKFDAIGAYRTTDQGLAIDTSGTSEGIGAFTGPEELGALLRNNEDAAACVVKNLYRHALGHIETKGEMAQVQELSAMFAAKGYRVRELLIDIVASPAFRVVGVPQ